MEVRTCDLMYPTSVTGKCTVCDTPKPRVATTTRLYFWRVQLGRGPVETSHGHQGLEVWNL